MRNNIGNGYTVADVWNKLASFGDSYAGSAAQVLSQPGSMAWTIVRGIWNVTNADFSKFDKVAKDHLTNYLGEIVRLNDEGKPNLPASDFIESSYTSALQDSGISPYTAIDVIVEKVISSYTVSPPHWYNTKGVVELEPERIRPSDPNLYKDLDPENARAIWYKTGVDGFANYVATAPVAMQQTLGTQLSIWMNGGKSFSLNSSGGVSYYFNAGTGNWAFFDKSGNGKASIGGNLQEVNQANWRYDANSGQYQLRQNDGRWQTAGLDQGGVHFATLNQQIYTWSPGGFSTALQLSALDKANLLASGGGTTTDGMSAEQTAMLHARQRADAWNSVLQHYPDAHLATDGQGNYALVGANGNMIGEVSVNGTMSVDIRLQDGQTISMYGDGQYGITQVNPSTGLSETMLYKADGTKMGLAPDNGAQNLAQALAVTASFLGLIQAIQSGKPLPVIGAGINTLAAINPTNTVLTGASAAVGAIASLINLQKNIQRGDAVGGMVAGANLISYGASAYASALGYTATQQASALTQAAAAGEFGAVSGAVGTVGQALPYLNLIYSLSQGDYKGAAVAATSAILVAQGFPVAGQIIAVAYLGYGMLTEDDLPSATGGYRWNSDGSVGAYISYTAGGGDRILAARLGSYLDTLKAIMNQAQAQNPAARLGLIANRLPGLNYGIGGALLSDIDPVTGRDRTITYDRDGRPVNATPGSPEFFRSLNEQFIYFALSRKVIGPSSLQTGTLRMK